MLTFAIVIHSSFSSDGVNLICGIPLTATALAVIGVIQSLGGIYIATGSNDDRLTHELFTRNFFTTAENNFMRLRAFSQHLASLEGQIFAIFVITVAAGEAAVGLAIIIQLYRLRSSINVDDARQLHG